ncbi:MAG: A/G-specific adenine glycosylase [Victivallaceae bacterium]|nr:A/G-specific adenine glycosylase [Victivallaceae bacterium]
MNPLPEMLPRLLIDWYRTHHRDLPWRKTRDPYAILISEVMLQQTRVETVIPYYRRFLERLPDFASLSQVPDEELLKLWQGLGYYRRAAMLKKTAIAVMREYGGVFPVDFETVLKLPGIGDYTAGAIFSIAFGQKRAAVDGNVLRVISRLNDDARDMTARAVRREIGNALESLYPDNAASEFTQSLMEIGATVCLPNGAPRCAECPLQTLCLALKRGIVALRPLKKHPKARKIEKKTFYLLRCNNKIALVRRPGQGMLANLYGFPGEDGLLPLAECRRRHRDWEIRPKSLAAKHIFTHIEWRMRWFRAETVREDPRFIWATREELEEKYPVPNAFSAYRKLL